MAQFEYHRLPVIGLLTVVVSADVKPVWIGRRLDGSGGVDGEEMTSKRQAERPVAQELRVSSEKESAFESALQQDIQGQAVACGKPCISLAVPRHLGARSGLKELVDIGVAQLPVACNVPAVVAREPVGAGNVDGQYASAARRSV